MKLTQSQENKHNGDYMIKKNFLTYSLAIVISLQSSAAFAMENEIDDRPKSKPSYTSIKLTTMLENASQDEKALMKENVSNNKLGFLQEIGSKNVIMAVTLREYAYIKQHLPEMPQEEREKLASFDWHKYKK